MNVTFNNFVYRRKQLHLALEDDQTLGSHTDIAVFTSNKITTFRWTHARVRPMGYHIAKQCPNEDCRSFKVEIPRSLNNQKHAEIVCSSCKNRQPFDFPTNWNWVRTPNDKEPERGGWIQRIENTARSNEDVEMAAWHSHSLAVTILQLSLFVYLYFRATSLFLCFCFCRCLYSLNIRAKYVATMFS